MRPKNVPEELKMIQVKDGAQDDGMWCAKRLKINQRQKRREGNETRRIEAVDKGAETADEAPTTLA
jgi:hypothetical protein